MSEADLPARLFARVDESEDRLFYAEPRLVLHIDAATVAALTQVYREELAPDSELLDLMSSWVSHLPEELEFRRVAGLGMNRAELDANPRLTERWVHDLNARPALPFAAASFDAALCAVSVQYLTRPVEVFREVARVLRPGGKLLIATSHRMFPTKAIAAWHGLAPADRLRLQQRYLELAGGFEALRLVDRSPRDADPLWVWVAARGEGPVSS